MMKSRALKYLLIATIIYCYKLKVADQSQDGQLDNNLMYESKVLNYMEFLENEQKKITNPFELILRAQIFLSRTIEIFHHNVLFIQKKISYHLDQNKFTDMTIEELRQNYILDKKDLDTDDNPNDQQEDVEQDQEDDDERTAKGLVDFSKDQTEIISDYDKVKDTFDKIRSTSGNFLQKLAEIVDLKGAFDAELNNHVDNHVGHQEDSGSDNLEAVIGQDKRGRKPNGIGSFLNKARRPLESLLRASRDSFVEYLKDEGIMEVKKQKSDRLAERKRVRMRIDWRITGCISEIKSQDSCNSCYAFATLGIIEYNHCREGNGLKSFSAQRLIDCGSSRGLKGCQGGKISNVCVFIKEFGIQFEDNYPYTGEQNQCQVNLMKQEIEKDLILYPKLNSFYNIRLDGWLEALRSNPIIVGIHMPADFFAYGGGIHDGSNCKSSMAHAMILVGYGLQDGQEFWLLKNSYSKQWGEQGYFRMLKNAPENCFNKAYYLKMSFRR